MYMGVTEKGHLVWYKKASHVDTAVLKKDGNTLNDKVGSGQK